MNWDAIGAISELLGASATVATLAYLAVQIRQNTNGTRVSVALARSEQHRQQAAFLSQSPEINRIFWAGIEEPELLSPSDFHYFESIMATYLSSFEASFNLHQEDALSASQWEGQLAGLRWVSTKPGFDRYWQTWRAQYSKDWSALVEEILRESKTPAQ